MAENLTAERMTEILWLAMKPPNAETDVSTVLMQLLDLEGRMDEAARELVKMADKAGTPNDQDRLLGKAEGVRLAKSYVNEEVCKWRTW